MEVQVSGVEGGVRLESMILEGVHNRYRLEINFRKDLNILYGKNGTGKTTLLHAIANVVNCDFLRFSFIDFKFVKATYSNGIWVSIFRDKDLCRVDCSTGDGFEFSREFASEILKRTDEDRFNREIVYEIVKTQKDFIETNNLRVIKTSYFPAFRTIIEAWSAQLEDNRSNSFRGRASTPIAKVTEFSRNLFGHFLPKINFPSPLDIEGGCRS